jgi:3-oxoacyl-ACP reductase-like protein
MKAERIALVLMLGIVACKSDKPKSTSAEPSAKPASAEPAKPTAPPPAAPSAAPASKPDLDKLCAKAKELSASPPEQQRALWGKAVRDIEDAGIKKGFSAIVGTDADIQYQMSLQIAKEAGAPGWSCPDLEALLKTMK